MCGIAGIIGSDTQAVAKAIGAMNAAQIHRGPDDGGSVLLEAGSRVIGLGHRRLAIIDPTPAGHQPMVDEKRGNWIIYNGEVYNFRVLRLELARIGEVFETGTDTEVILKAYGVWGTESFARLRGIFAFAIWDGKRKFLLLCRDPLGVKPLYFYEKENGLIFASEVRAILSTGFIPRKLDLDGLISYLAYGALQEPYTLVQGIRSLAPGYFMEVNVKKPDLECKETCFHSIPRPSPIVTRAYDGLIEELRERLADSVSSQMIADVPLGAFLSGGIDSTAITALMKAADQGPVKSFSLVFEEKTYDERRWSRLAAERIGSLHNERLLTGEEVLAEIEKALSSYDQPSIDGLNTYFVSKAARDSGLTVALSGLGGDEVFGGYDGFAKALLAERIRPFIKMLPNTAGIFISRLIEPFARREFLRKGAEVLTTRRHPYFGTRRLFSDRQIGKILSPEIRVCDEWENTSFDKLEESAEDYDPINRASAFEMQTYMRSTLLRDTDQMSMAHSLEVRVPLLDPDLVEFIFTIPGQIKLDRKQPKPLLTRPLADLIPEECIYRSKQGFELPFEVWFRKAMKGKIEEDLCKEPEEGVFSRKGLRNLWQSFEAGHITWSRVWAVYVLKYWLMENEVQV